MKQGVRQLRIVGGSLRGRRLRFPDAAGLRPTPDRVRETLFNWLAPYIGGMRVLDLFAGSGALGFEALSRGAQDATLVDASPTVGRQLRATAADLGLAAVRVETAEALDFLRREGGPWDLIFVDPPFAAGLLAPVMTHLAASGQLSPRGFCYVEAARGTPLPPLPAGWRLHRSGTAGEVGYHLLHESGSDLSGDVRSHHQRPP
ncbi:MAG: 16S rRNA (guanine(966)-N(2))-methyltransferase RsmD [Steroidobacteraceae bacterium]